MIPSGQVTVAAPAKVNLHLGVGPARSDGYHELATVFQALDLTDELTVGHAEDVTLVIDGDDQGLPTGPDNLAVKAALLLKQRCEVGAGAAMTLTKRIPVAGGMAGGSTDAAAALVACNTLWGSPASPGLLMELAAELGSDVPFCLHGGTAMGSSRGEVLTPVLTTGSFTWVVATSFGHLSTPAVYRRFDEMRGADVPAPSVPTELMLALRAGDREAVGGSLHNDLQRPAISLMPELDMLLEAGRDFGALGAMVSGSGPTTVYLARDYDHGLELAVLLMTTGLCRSTKVAGAPAHGARVVHEPNG
jgi:4-diphosphocytidyl-2-C-methyl-D-erythritol kinase